EGDEQKQRGQVEDRADQVEHRIEHGLAAVRRAEAENAEEVAHRGGGEVTRCQAAASGQLASAKSWRKRSFPAFTWRLSPRRLAASPALPSRRYGQRKTEQGEQPVAAGNGGYFPAGRPCA